MANRKMKMEDVAEFVDESGLFLDVIIEGRPIVIMNQNLWDAVLFSLDHPDTKKFTKKQKKALLAAGFEVADTKAFLGE